MQPNGTSRWWALAGLSLAILAASLDVTVLTLALPTLAGAFKASEAQLQWFVTAYTLALVAAMLPAGLMGDRWGRRRVALGALILFAAGSLGCALAPSGDAFLVARIVIGAAGAALTVMALSIITVLFEPAERPRAIGVWSAANFVALPIGPILGGWILAHAWWGWIFLLNVPVAIVAVAALIAFVPESRAPVAPSVDGVGILLSSAGLVAFMDGLIRAGDAGWSDPLAIGTTLAGLLMLLVFGLWERRLGARPGGAPLVDLGLFRARGFSAGVVLTAFGGLVLFGILFALPQYLQAVRGLDAEGTGLRLLPLIAGLVAGALPADRFAARIGPRRAVAVGFAVMAGAAAVGATTTVASGDALTAAWTLVAGFGAGICFATAAASALVALSAERSGVGAALLQAVTKLGPALGATLLGSVLNGTYRASLDLHGVPVGEVGAVEQSVFGGLATAQRLGHSELLASVRAAFVAGMDAALVAAAVIAVIGLGLALAFLAGRTVPDPTAAGASAMMPSHASGRGSR